MSRRVSVAGAFPAFPVAAVLLTPRLANNKKIEAINHTANHCVKVLFFISCLLWPPLQSFLYAQYSTWGEPLSMTSEVMAGQRTSQMVPSLMQGPRDYRSSVSAVRVASSGGERASDAHFLHGNVLRRSQGCKSRKEAQRGVVPSIVEVQNGGGVSGIPERLVPSCE